MTITRTFPIPRVCRRSLVGLAPSMRRPTPLGDVSIGSLEESTDEQWANSIKFKGMGQINLVRAALPFIADRGSFTLVSGVLTDEYLHGGT